MTAKISVIAPSRPNSKFLAHFVLGYLNKTTDKANTELLIMASAKDEWNKDLFEYFKDDIQFFFEDYGLGQSGHHVYLNELAEKATGDWVIALCDDMAIEVRGWDNNLRDFITGRKLDSNLIYQIIPGFTQPGAVEHILSRGYLDAVGHWSKYPNTDSFLNSVIDNLPEKIKRDRRVDFTLPMFTDYSRDALFGKLMNTDYPTKGERKVPQYRWDEAHITELVKEDVNKIEHEIKNGK